MIAEERFAEMATSHSRCFWLDAGPGNAGRSIMGALHDDDISLTYDAGRREVLRHRGGDVSLVGTDIFSVLGNELARTPQDEIWVGYFGYACRPDLPARISRAGDSAMPDAIWMRTRHTSSIGQSPAHPARTTTRLHPAPSVNTTPIAYARAFDEVQRELRAGNTYEVNLTHRIEVQDAIDPAVAYLRLRELNPAPYAGFIQHHGFRLLSSSPERYATIDRHRQFETRPIKGTTPRGVYSGAFGWIAPDGRADLGVVIRSLTTTGNGTWELGTGGGITVRSTAQDEYAESGWKAERLLRVFGTPLACD